MCSSAETTSPHAFPQGFYSGSRIQALISDSCFPHSYCILQPFNSKPQDLPLAENLSGIFHYLTLESSGRKKLLKK